MLRLIRSSTRAKTKTLDDEAFDWVVKLTSGETSAEDHAAFRQWRDQSSQHLDALRRARDLWNLIGLASPALPESGETKTTSTLARWAAMPLAATLACAVYFGQGYWAVGQFDQATALGERRQFSLPDGTQILMSGDTALDVSLENRTRRIDLARGTILVRVRHDEQNPFIVVAGDAQFRDIGTVLQVSREADGGRLVVLEGVVEAANGTRRTLVKPNQAASVDRDTNFVSAADASTETAWMRGRLVLKNKTTSQIIEAIRPYYGRRIVLLRPIRDDTLLDADIDLNHIDAWLGALEELQGIRATEFAGMTFLS